jgi:hypothetical protein
MFDELGLSQDLAACEARLASQPLAASGLDRDQLMYRAGWAAREASQVAASRAPVDREPRQRSVAGWSLTSAAVAASLAVIVTFQWRPAVDRKVAAKSPNAESSLPTIPAEAPPPTSTVITVMESSPAPRRARQLDIGLFRLRRQALRGDLSEPAGIASLTVDSAPPAPQTALELRQELLPGEAAVPATVWLWGI